MEGSCRCCCSSASLKVSDQCFPKGAIHHLWCLFILSRQVRGTRGSGICGLGAARARQCPDNASHSLCPGQGLASPALQAALQGCSTSITCPVTGAGGSGWADWSIAADLVMTLPPQLSAGAPAGTVTHGVPSAQTPHTSTGILQPEQWDTDNFLFLILSSAKIPFLAKHFVCCSCSCAGEGWREELRGTLLGK